MIPVSPKLSVTIITFNEEKNIERCLESVKWADEIVVVDSYSTDRTVEICRRFTDRIYLHQFEGHIEQKNISLSCTAGEWILAVDADEIISEALRAEIKKVLSAPQSFDGFYINRENYYLGERIRHSGWSPDYKIRLFRKEKGIWSGINPHDSIMLKGKVGRLKAPILHYSYPDLSRHFATIDFFTTITAREYFKSGKRCKLSDLLIRPKLAFLKKYFLKCGFLDGIRGIMIAVTTFFYVFLKYAKLWELGIAKNTSHKRGDGTSRR